MSVERYSYGDAVRHLGGNAYARWAIPDRPDGTRHPHTVASRIESGIAFKLQPKFRLAPGDRLFTMGSCFARNVEQCLIDLGFDVPSYAGRFASDWEARGPSSRTPREEAVFRMGYANKYNTPSMLTEFEWAAAGMAAEACPTILSMGDGRVVDLNAHNVLAGDDRKSVLARRRLLNEITRTAFEADVVFLTLGLTEAWFDTTTGLILNDQVSALRPAEADQDRFAFRVLSFSENRAALEGIHDLLRRHGKPGCRMIVTVSPVPLLATLTPKDVLIANTYSKAVLHAVASEFCASRPDADYFPSYEMVLHAKPEAAWERDLRHVREDMVERIMRAFVQAYVEGR